MHYGHLRGILTGFMVLLSLSVGAAESADDFAPNHGPTLRVTPKQGDIKIDGVIDDAGWRTAAIADNFCEFTPRDMTKPAVETKVLVTYDESGFYVAFVCYDNPNEVRASLRQRDNIFLDDYCGILLDTYSDQSWGYEIFVNPLGIQGDLRQLANGAEEESFDIIFESVGQVTDSGYQVEIYIPFASLRFPNSDQQNWRINFWRDRQRDARYRYTWSAIDRGNPCFMCQWGYITGIEDIKPSTNLEILPSVIGYESGHLLDPENPESRFFNADPDGEFSLGVRYGITPNASAEITINPDFSQVESDAGQIDVNTTFGLYFPERRPFFQEGSDLFSTWINAVYTRTINNPDVAGRIAGQFGKYSLAYLAAYDQNTPIMVPLLERSLSFQADEAVVNIFRARRAFGDNTYLGLIATDRRLLDFPYEGVDIKGGAGSVYGFDGSVRFLTHFRYDLQVLGSHTEEPGAGKPDSVIIIAPPDQTFDNGHYTAELDGEKFDGRAVYTSLRRESRIWNADLSYNEFSPTFRTDNGFNTRNNTRQLEFWTGLDFRPNREWLISWQPFVTCSRVWNYDGTVNLDPGAFDRGARDEWIIPQLSFTFKGQTGVEFSYLWSREHFANRIFPGIRRWSLNVSSRFSEYVNVDGSMTIGKIIYRDPVHPELGDAVQMDFGVDLKPTMRLYISTTLEYAKMDHRDSYFEVHPLAEKNIYSGYIMRSRLTYQFTREWFLRLVVQYDDFDRSFDLEPLLTWQLNPFTVFYIGMNSRYRYFDADDFEPDQRLFDKSKWEQSQRQFFAKLQYLFRV